MTPIRLIASFIILSLSFPAFSENGDQIIEILKKRDASIKETLGPEGTEYSSKQREALKSLISGLFDFETMAKTAMDSHWKGLKTTQQKDFVSLFSELVKKSSLRTLDIYRAKIRYRDVEFEKEKVLAHTTAVYKRKRTDITYAMQKKDSDWYVTDFLLDDVSTTESYQKSFDQIIRKHGYPGLVKRLKKKIAKLK